VIVSERERGLEPSVERGKSGSGARGNLRPLIIRRGKGFAMCDVCMDTCSDKEPYVIK